MPIKPGQLHISGTWTPTGNPYIATDNCTIPTGQTLTIQPGVIVWIGENLSITGNGSIQAMGTPSQRITFQAPIASQFWSSIIVNYSAETNRFKYCDFKNGNRALYLRVYNVNATMYAEVMNCTFSNCPDAAVYGESEGTSYFQFDGNPVLSPVVKNCVFANCGDGCRFKIFGYAWVSCCPGYLHVGAGGATARIVGNIFANLSGAALDLTTNRYPKSSTADFINNTVVNCAIGVDSQEPWDARVQNCIFASTTNAVRTSGALSRTVGYNDFYENATNFAGYPPLYGQFILQNRNGTPCDILLNIAQNPLFVAPDDFHLATNSPCVDAGAPDTAFCDLCLTNNPSLGTQFPDLGGYGGPDACNWLDVVPVFSTQPWMSVSNEIVRINWNAIPRSTYRIQYITNLSDTTWKTLTQLTAEERLTSQMVTSTNMERYFRIQSLGRFPGD